MPTRSRGRPVFVDPVGTGFSRVIESDKKKEKSIARTMLRMTRTINNDYLVRVDPQGQKVACITCHLGHAEPPPPPPPAQEETPAPPKS